MNHKKNISILNQIFELSTNKKAKRSFIHLEGGAYKNEFQEDKRHGYGENKRINDRIYKGMWKNGKGHSVILVCILIFILDELIFFENSINLNLLDTIIGVTYFWFLVPIQIWESL